MRVALLAFLLVLLAGCGTSTVPVPTFAPTPRATTPTAAVAEPVRVDVPAIGAAGDLVALGLNPDGTLAVPPVTEPEVPSWYELGPRPGEPGPAVIAGHVNGDGRPGIFARLGEVEPGEPVHVDRADGSQATFVVTRVESHSKTEFPTMAVYGDTPGPELRLITCSGPFDRDAASYVDNTVVFATLEQG